MIKYYKLFDLLNRKEMKKTDLLNIISSPTLAKLSKGEIIRTDIIDKICLFLECQPSDIMECLYDEHTLSEFKIGEFTISKSIVTEKSIINDFGESEDIIDIRKEYTIETEQE